MKETKLHLACGTVYLEGWTNIDLPLPHHYLAKDRPDLVDINKTTQDKYYKEKVTVEDFKTGKLQFKQVVVDQFADVRELPYPDGSVSEILGVQLFEHFSIIEARKLLNHWYEKLKKGGVLTLHVPDLNGILRGFEKDKDVEWMIRQIYGSQKNEFGIHKYGYTFKTLKKLLEAHGFKQVLRVASINDYPAFGITAIK